MAYEKVDQGPLDYRLCRYGTSKLMFRGPKRNIKGKYHAFLGGTETFGKYIEKPFAELLEDELNMPCANLGAMNAGVDAYVGDTSLLEICSKAKTTVIQVMGAQNMSNRFYSVHPRRNDRFLQASSLMETIFREVDFTEFSFTRHMLGTLRSISPDKFEMLEVELKEAWLGRMRHMLKQISGRTVLLWMSDHTPDDVEAVNDLARDPMFVDRAMIERIRPYATEVVEVVLPTPGGAEGMEDGLVYPEMDAAAAAEMYGPSAHRIVADRLRDVL
jgi:hypothetical protein